MMLVLRMRTMTRGSGLKVKGQKAKGKSEVTISGTRL
jgi:hypothetical protein